MLFDLNNKQENRFSEICMGIGHIALASVVVPAFFDKINLFLLTWGLVAAIYFWRVSIWILKDKE